MRGFAVLACGALLVGCSAEKATPPAPTTVVEYVTEAEAPAAPKPNPHAALIDAYSKVLDNPLAYEYNKSAEFVSNGKFDYAIVEVTGDDSPELLLMPNSAGAFYPITVFSKPAGGELFNTKSVLIEGASSAGGSRAGIMASKTGIGLYQGSWQSAGPSVSSEKFEIRDKDLVSTGLKETLPYPHMYDAEHLKIEWTPSTDRGPLQRLGGSAPASVSATTMDKCGTVGDKTVFTGTAETSCQFAKAVANAAKGKDGNFSVQATSPVTGQSYDMNCTSSGSETVCTGGNNASVVLRPAAPGEEQASAYEYTFEGIVVIKSAIEVSPPQGIPNGEGPENEYFMLVFDAPQDVTAIKGGPDRPETRTVDSIGLASKHVSKYGTTDHTGPWRQYAGKRIRLHINTDSMRYQTDASLPMGRPRVITNNADYEVEVLN